MGSMRERQRSRWSGNQGLTVAALCAGLFLGGPAVAVDFLRGDANSDGVVSLADSEYLLRYMFRGGDAPACLRSGDVKADNGIDITDAYAIAIYLFRDGPPPPSPFPAPGPDDGAGLPCEAYGGGSP